MLARFVQLIALGGVLCVLSSCGGGQADRAEPGTARIDHRTYDERGKIRSSTNVTAKNDEDSREGFNASMTDKGVNVGTSGSKDAVFNEAGEWTMWVVGGSICIIVGGLSLLARMFGIALPGLTMIPRGPSWGILFAGIGMVCAQWMTQIVALAAIGGILAGVYFLSLQKNYQETKKGAG